jgi:hypothetical protein
MKNTAIRYTGYMASKQTSLVLAIVGVGVVLALIFFARTATAPVQTNTASTPIDITEYVKKHISELSPVHEQVGGKFFVTSVEAHGGAGTASYEDGHNAYTADFTYSANDKGAPHVDSFVVRQ